jgi:prolyl-tRNA synthetase
VAVLVRGDHDVNETKLARAAGASGLRLASAQTIERVSGAPVGFTGPVKLSVRVIADHAVMRMANAVTGANKAEAHAVNVNPGRDFTPASVADVRLITPEDPCPKCGGKIEFLRAIESGHVFQLGTKYSQALGAAFQDPSGKQVPMVMGCYGIGVNRILATAIEQRHDANGIIWPPGIAPFPVVISVLEAENAEALKAADEAEQALAAAGLEPLVDDRPQSPGSKLKDADLIGLPVQVVIGRTWLKEGKFEVAPRATKEKTLVEPSGLVDTVHKLLDKVSAL